MAGGKGKSIGGKATGAKDSTTKSQKSHSAKAGLQVSDLSSTPIGLALKRILSRRLYYLDMTSYVVDSVIVVIRLQSSPSAAVGT